MTYCGGVMTSQTYREAFIYLPYNLVNIPRDYRWISSHPTNARNEM